MTIPARPVPADMGPLATRLAELAVTAGLTVCVHRSAALGLVVQIYRADGVDIGGVTVSELTGTVVGAWMRDLLYGEPFPLIGKQAMYHQLAILAAPTSDDLAGCWAADNAIEAAGELRGGDRLTCYACRCYLTGDHHHGPSTGQLVAAG